VVQTNAKYKRKLNNTFGKCQSGKRSEEGWGADVPRNLTGNTGGEKKRGVLAWSHSGGYDGKAIKKNGKNEAGEEGQGGRCVG